MKPNVTLLMRNASLALMLLNGSILAASASGQENKKESPQEVTRVPVVFSGGHETEGVDHGRPVVLVAAALGVAPEVFREAFSRVRPAGSGGPSDAVARRNKDALLGSLGKHGITNERLDAVSDFYRLPAGRGAIWTSKPASANALVKDGAVIGFEIVSGGAGYSSVPTISVPGVEGVRVRVELSFGKDLEKNGAVSAITLEADKASAR